MIVLKWPSLSHAARKLWQKKQQGCTSNTFSHAMDSPQGSSAIETHNLHPSSPASCVNSLVFLSTFPQPTTHRQMGNLKRRTNGLNNTSNFTSKIIKITGPTTSLWRSSRTTLGQTRPCESPLLHSLWGTIHMLIGSIDPHLSLK